MVCHSFEFTGAALALHSTNSQEFTTTVSVDGWIRGQPTEIIMQQIELEKEKPTGGIINDSASESFTRFCGVVCCWLRIHRR